MSQASAGATERFILPLAQTTGIMSPYYRSSIFRGMPMARLARDRAARVMPVSSSSSRRFTTERLVCMRAAISVFDMCSLFMASVNCQAITRLTAAATASSRMPSSLRKSSKSLPICLFSNHASYNWSLRVLAISISAMGVSRDFLMKACSKTRLLPITVKSARNIRRSRWMRTSHKSFPFYEPAAHPMASQIEPL